MALEGLAGVIESADAIKRKEVGYRQAIAAGQQLADQIGFRTLIQAAQAVSELSLVATLPGRSGPITMASQPMTLSKAEFDHLFASVSNWGRWGRDDQRGTLNLITPERVAAASALVRRGRSVSLSYLLSKAADIDNPKPMLHYMSRLSLGMPGEPKMNEDFIGLDYHGKLVTHVDALCHCAYGGRLYNDVVSLEAVTGFGARFGAVTSFEDGIIGRPWMRARGVAVLGSDADTDARPSPVSDVHTPAHALALAAMGMPLLDNMNLDRLAATCADESRWEFLFVTAPLRLPGGTGSPINPLAIF